MNFDPDRFLFFEASFLVPAILVALNLIIRNARKWYYTVGSDIFFGLIAFNFSSVVVLDDVKGFIRYPAFK